jgi:hypothetical protein
MANPIVSENTVVRLGLVVTILAGVVAFTWWASGVNSSLNSLLAGQTRDSEQSTGLRARVETLERATDMFTQVGSPALRPRLDALEKWREQIQSSGSPKMIETERRLNVLEKEFELYKQRTEKK